MITRLRGNVSIFLLLVFATISTAIFITLYCDSFYDFGILAKKRIIENPVIAFFLAPVFFWLSAYLCRRFAVNASGSNLQHIKLVLDQLKNHPNSFEKVSAFINLRVAIVNAASSLISSFGGGFLGREGSSVHISASIFAVIAHKFRSFLPKINLESWVFIGAGVGFAIAFKAPLAGLAYVTEKLFRTRSKNFSNIITWTFFAMLLLSILFYKTTPIFATEQVKFSIDAEIFLIILIAIICGIAAIIFLKASFFCYEKIRDIKSKKWHLIPIICGFVVSTISLYGGIYSIGGGIKTISDTLTYADIFLSQKEVFGRIFAAFFTFISGNAGGLVLPAMAIGANIGSVFSVILANLDPRIFILIGMVAFLTPVIEAPFATAIIILQISSQSLLAFPFLFFASLISFFTVRLLSKLTSKSKNN